MPLALIERMHRFVELSRAVRRAGNAAQLGFLICNRTRELVDYRQAVLWRRAEVGGPRIVAASGVAEVDTASPYVALLAQVLAHCDGAARPVAAADAPPALPAAVDGAADAAVDAAANAAVDAGANAAVHAATGLQALPPLRTYIEPARHARDAASHARADRIRLALPAPLDDAWRADGAPCLVCIPLRGDGSLGLALLRDTPPSDAEGGVLSELQELYAHAARAIDAPAAAQRLRDYWQPRRRKLAIAAAVTLGVALLFPVRLSVVASGQLVARDPALITAPLNGVVSELAVQPSAPVRAGQVLLRIDDRDIAQQLAVAEDDLAAAQERLRQSAERSLDDAPGGPMGSERGGEHGSAGMLEYDVLRARAQRDYYAELHARVEVRAPVAGVALYSSPQDWIGRPVKIGEKLMEVASPQEVAVEAWVPAADAIPLAVGDELVFYPEAFPLSAVHARLVSVAYLAEQRGEGQPLVYRVRARVDGATAADARVGQTGTARLYGERTVLAYLLLRRPLNALRQWAGI